MKNDFVTKFAIKQNVFKFAYFNYSTGCNLRE